MKSGCSQTRLATSAAITVAAENAVPAVTVLSPASIVAGSGGVTLNVTGTGFVSGAIVRVNGSNRSTTFSSATQLTAMLTAGDVASQGMATITVFNPTPGGGTSNGSPLTILAAPAAPTITTLSPASVAAGSGGTSLIVTGTGFVSTSVVRVNGSARATTFNSPTQVTVALLAGDLASAATLAMTVMTPAPGGGTSNSASLMVTGPTLTVNATSTTPAASDVVMTLTSGRGGTQDWLTIAKTTDANEVYGAWTYVGAGVTTRTWNPPMPSQPGVYEFRLFANNGYTRIASSPAITVSAVNGAPTIMALTPSSVVAGSSGFTLAVTGSGFVHGAVVRINGSDRTTTFSSATQLTAAITTGDVANQGTATITVFNPAPGGGTSSGRALTVAVPPVAPTITALNPTSIAAGSSATALTVMGTDFVSTSVVRVNGSARTTTFKTSTQLTVALLASDLASAGTLAITAITPAPGGGTSNSLSLTVAGPALTVNSTETTPGASNVVMTLANGLGGAQDWLTIARTTDANTIYGSWTYVGTGVTSRTWTPPMPSQAGVYEFRLFANNGYTRLATSPAITVASASPAPTITTLSPASVAAGSSGFMLTVNGTGFVTGAIVRVNGSERATAFTSPTQIGASILASDVANGGALAITASTPGGGTTHSVSLTVTGPTLTVNTMTSTAGATDVVMNLTNGLGGTQDWLTIAKTTDPSTTYGVWTYVGAGMTTGTWNPPMPSQPGTYEFRLFANNGYTRLATSAPIFIGP